MQGTDGRFPLDPDWMDSDAIIVKQLKDVQRRIGEEGLGGWLLYDFRGSNPTTVQALGLDGLMLTRRLFYFIPAQGPCLLVHHTVDRPNLPSLPGQRLEYSGWRDLERHMRGVLAGRGRVAMEYFEDGAIPYLSRVDAGTVSWVRRLGAEVLSSADLAQFFLCRFTPEQAAAHREAALALHQIKEQTFAMVRDRLRAGDPPQETEIQGFVMARFTRAGLVTDHPPVVSTGSHTADPHHQVSPDSTQEVQSGQLLMLALWGRHDRPVTAYADLTWMAVVGENPAERQAEAFRLVVKARDAGLERVRRGYSPGQKNGLQGWEVDRAVRDVIEAEGYGGYFTHRTGHNIGALSGHGDGTHIDDLETHDTRPLIEGLCFTLEPGLYLEDFGVRTGIDLFLAPTGVQVAAPMQSELDRLF